ncbi:MAG: alanine--tRNA ligase [Dehalococcoidia bacterium]|nr:alanine--tRNA ligase [Dehalococcoidia bacterium]
MQTAAEIRKAFLDFFQSKEHLLVPSSSLIPAGDPTLLLTSAGMVQFKPYFTGEMKPPQPRLTTVQKCFRVSDVDSVGDTSHLTFFEMLGNFSIGDYFKKDAIAWGWEFVTQVMGLPPEKLWATVFRDDDEAYALWQQTGIPARRIRRFEEKDNFWGPAGDEGPCGPCSEIHYDFGGKCRLGKPLAKCGPNCQCGRFLELWNLVFMQFYQDKQGKRTPLPRPNIDTGMGLERAALILQGKASIYETDLFVPIVQRVCELAGKTYGQDAETDKAIRVVAEHARSAAFLIADGVVPDNKGRGYVLRRLIRRAIRYGRKLGLESATVVPDSARGSTGSPRTDYGSVRPELVEGRGVLPQVAQVVIRQMGSAYPELVSGQEFILRVLQLEEERFGETYERGILLFQGFYDHIGHLQNELQAHLSLEYPPSNASDVEYADFARFRDSAISFLAFHGFTYSGSPSEPEMAGRQMSVDILVLPLRDAEALALRTTSGNPQFDAITSRLRSIQQRLDNAKRRVPGLFTFILCDTYGFPPELVEEIANERQLEGIDWEGFQKEMEAQRQRARAAGGFGTGLDAVRVYQELGVAGTRFLGYETLSAPSVVVALLVNGTSADKADEGQQVEVVLRETPFYAEGGGQAGDTGFIEAPGWFVQVEDTQSPIAGLIVHKGKVVRGTAQLGEIVTATVDRERRMDCARNHTATHLLHAALRQVLGTHVRQQGSMVAPDRLRFDFTHVSPLTPEELQQVEALVNDRIRANVPVHKRETTYRQAVADGALAFFGERYGDRVRVVEVPVGATHASPLPHGQAHFSMEVCGGTHIDATGEIGYCHVMGESSVGAGLRRIEAVTGRAAEALVRDQVAALSRLARQLETSPQELDGRVATLLEEVAQLRRQVAAHERASSRQQAQALLERVQESDGLKLVSGVASVGSADALREVGDWLRDKLGSGVVVLGAVVNDRPTLLVMVTKDLVARGLHAGNVVKEAAKVMGGGGGGRPEMAQAGGRQADKLGEALDAAVAMVSQQAKGS